MFEDKESLTREEKRIRKRASEWLVEQEGGWEPGREEQFSAWKDADLRHVIALRELESSWIRLKQLRNLFDDPTLRPNADILTPGIRRQRRRRNCLVAFAGTLVALLALTFWIWTTADNRVAPSPQSPVTFSTTVNDYKQVTLDDGSILELNANTEVSIQFSESLRQVFLIRGEAHFKVEKGASRPFLVDAGGILVKAVGTAFNVRYDSDEVEVLVTEGRVSVNATSPEPGDPYREDELSTVPELIAGDQARISIKGTHLVPLKTKVKAEEYEKILAWKGPRLFFNKTPLEEALRQFNEHNAVQVIIEGEELRNLSIGGSFLVEDVEAFVRLLARDDNITVDRSHYDKVVLKPADAATAH